MGGIRVALIAGSEHVGGAEIYMERLSALLSDVGVQVYLVGGLPNWVKTAEDRELSLRGKWTMRRPLQAGLSLIRERNGFREALRETRPDVIWAHFKREQIAISRLAASIAPVVWTEHGVLPEKWPHRLMRWPYRMAARHAERVVCVSQVVRRSVGRAVGGVTMVDVIETGVDTAQRRPASTDERYAAREELGLEQGAVVACFLGRMASSKRPGLAIEAALAAGATIVLAGDGPETAALRSIYGSNDKVRICGHVNDTARVYMASDVHLFTSDGSGEGMPTVILEAAAHGVPTVIASDSGFGYLAEASGNLCAGATSGEFAAAVLKAMERPELGHRARAWAQNNDVKLWRDRYAEMFRMAAAGV
jgi:glycosyltransferase involved in cell wall biosynthesis